MEERAKIKQKSRIGNSGTRRERCSSYPAEGGKN